MSDRAPAVTLRVAAVSDAPVVAQVAEAWFRATFAPDNLASDMDAYCAASFSAALQRDEIDDPRMTWLLAEVGAEVVGFAQVERGVAPSYVSGTRPLQLARLYVSPTWHGGGVGARLMTRVLDIARDEGHDSLWLGVWERNARAQAFYHRFGFAYAGDTSFLLGADCQRDLVLVRSVP